MSQIFIEISWLPWLKLSGLILNTMSAGQDWRAMIYRRYLGEVQLIFWSVSPRIVNFRSDQIKKPPISIYFLLPPNSDISLYLMDHQKLFTYKKLWNVMRKRSKTTQKIQLKNKIAFFKLTQKIKEAFWDIFLLDPPLYSSK